MINCIGRLLVEEGKGFVAARNAAIRKNESFTSFLQFVKHEQHILHFELSPGCAQWVRPSDGGPGLQPEPKQGGRPRPRHGTRERHRRSPSFPPADDNNDAAPSAPCCSAWWWCTSNTSTLSVAQKHSRNPRRTLHLTPKQEDVPLLLPLPPRRSTRWRRIGTASVMAWTPFLATRTCRRGRPSGIVNLDGVEQERSLYFVSFFTTLERSMFSFGFGWMMPGGLRTKFILPPRLRWVGGESCVGAA